MDDRIKQGKEGPRAFRYFRRLFCRHTQGLDFIVNLYGDQIIEYGYARSLWRCLHCGSLVRKAELGGKA